MVSAVGFAVAPGVTSSVTPSGRDGGAEARPAGLQVELARVKKEYSACVNCSSADTESGQRNIEQLSTRIQQIEARIDAVKPSSRSEALTSTLREQPSAIGSQLDVYA